MSWNYRVVRREHDWGVMGGETLYEIHECYYDANGKIEHMTIEGVDPVGDDLEGLRWTLAHMLDALDKPVVDYKTQEEIP